MPGGLLLFVLTPTLLSLRLHLHHWRRCRRSRRRCIVGACSIPMFAPSGPVKHEGRTQSVDSFSRDTMSLSQPWRASGLEGGSPRKGRNVATSGASAANALSQMTSNVQKTRLPSTTTASVAGPSNTADRTHINSETNAQPNSTGSALDSNNAAGDTTLLRDELENLRREVVEIRQQRLYEDAPPPEYSDGGIR